MLANVIANFFFHPNHSYKWQVIFWLNTALLLFLTLSAPIKTGVSLPHADKIFHFIGFGAFSFFLFLGYSKFSILLNVTFSFILGLVVEIAQSYIPSRSFDILDLIADVCGSLAAVIFLTVMKGILSPKP